ncbi:three-Cys-motif partner protein TcmP [Desulfurobacterium sp.]|uniref:three-Cys-motif partner protein TcmP n=1 Tax=Desulfurobacterium sp. TaxID=2004706 RepID=UPI00261B10FF|nr:three-Cys-motif partner protein TcmP [Desulfurobacterium sp.]
MVKTEGGLWDITNRLSTKTKLELIKKIFNMWLTIWQAQSWVCKEWYVIDLFAGQGFYIDSGKKVPGSFLIFLETINSQIIKLKSKNIKIYLFGIEKNSRNYGKLKNEVESFLDKNPELNEVIEYQILRGDCNERIDEVISQIANSNRNPLFILVDPTGLQIRRTTMEKIIRLRNLKDILFNYILEGVRRTSGVASKLARGEELSKREIKTVSTLKDFLGHDVEIIKEKRPEDLEVLRSYVNAVYTDKSLCVVGYDVEYPDRKDDLYYLLFASRNQKIVEIVKDIYARQKEKVKGPTLFGREFYVGSILEISPKSSKTVTFIKRKNLLYRTKVEYGDWTINHIIGCAHGCKFPCYAMMMARRFGWVKNYNDWRKPRVAGNALEILEKELEKYKNDINFVHLSFMTDPFMYDIETGDLIPEVKELTLQIIGLLNESGIRVTTLTKGFYPEEILKMNFMKDNEYGITLVSLNDRFKKKFEPYSAPYEKRINSLYMLHSNGLKTWVSIEPYPTPNLDETAEDIECLLERISFVDKIIFGKINYNIQSKNFENGEEFYQKIAKKVIEFCEKHHVKYHIKFGTPYSKENTKDIFNSYDS